MKKPIVFAVVVVILLCICCTNSIRGIYLEQVSRIYFVTQLELSPKLSWTEAVYAFDCEIIQEGMSSEEVIAVISKLEPTYKEQSLDIEGNGTIHINIPKAPLLTERVYDFQDGALFYIAGAYASAPMEGSFNLDCD